VRRGPAIALRALGDGQAFVDGDGTRAAIFMELALGMCEEYEPVIRVFRIRGSIALKSSAPSAPTWR